MRPLSKYPVWNAISHGTVPVMTPGTKLQIAGWLVASVLLLLAIVLGIGLDDILDGVSLLAYFGRAV